MRDRHAVGLDRCQRLSKKALPRKAAGDFDRDAVLAGFARHVRIAGDRRHTQTIRERAAKRRVGVRFRASNLMVEMRESCENDSPRAARSRNRKARATESEPPDTAATTRVSGVQSACLAEKLRTRS